MDINAAQIHLMVNHIPILLTIFSIPVLVWGIIAKQQAIKKVALAGFIVAGVTVIIAVQSGESAEDIVESMPTVAEETIHDHEEAAETAQWLTIILGVGAIAGYIMTAKQMKHTTTLIWGLLIYSLVVGSILIYTANLGGKIMHPELRSDTNTTQPITNESDDD